MASLFSRLFKYRPSEHRNPTEDFFTEIFAFLLENVPNLLESFLKDFGIITQTGLENIKVETQDYFIAGSGKIKPDIAIRFSIHDEKWIVFFENKISAIEGKDQLERYSDYLRQETQKGTNCVLLYITRSYDPTKEAILLNRVEEKGSFAFYPIRWWQVHSFLEKFESPFIYQARLYMKENGMSMSRNFSPAQIMTMMQWPVVREMMEASLGDAVEEKFEQITKSKYKLLAKTDEYFRAYGDYIRWAGGLFWLEIGYFFVGSSDENYPNIGGAIVVEPGHSNRLQVVQAFNEFVRKNDTWELYGNFHNEEEIVWITKGQSLKKFISSDDHISAIQKLFLKVLSDMETFKNENPWLSWD